LSKRNGDATSVKASALSRLHKHNVFVEEGFEEVNNRSVVNELGNNAAVPLHVSANSLVNAVGDGSCGEIGRFSLQSC
jgi:hypothetical protein